MLLAMSTWLTILVCWPAPGPPWWTIVLPIACQQGCRASTTSASPPIMIDKPGLAGADVAAGDRGVDAGRPCGPAASADLDGQATARWWSCRRGCCPGRQPANTPSGAEDHLAHVGRIADDREDDVAPLGDGPGAVGPGGARGPAAVRLWPGCGCRRWRRSPADQVAAHAGPITPVPIQPMRVTPGVIEGAVISGEVGGRLDGLGELSTQRKMAGGWPLPSEAELRGSAFPSWSLGTRHVHKGQTRVDDDRRAFTTPGVGGSR